MILEIINYVFKTLSMLIIYNITVWQLSSNSVKNA
jgi:hypothetical protein